MNMKQAAELFGIKENNKAMKNKEKAREIIDKILKCPKCKQPMKWVEGTNVCTCENCHSSTFVNGEKKTFSTFKTVDKRSFRFLENNYLALKEEV